MLVCSLLAHVCQAFPLECPGKNIVAPCKPLGTLLQTRSRMPLNEAALPPVFPLALRKFLCSRPIRSFVTIPHCQ